jgi:predicted aconitase
VFLLYYILGVIEERRDMILYDRCREMLSGNYGKLVRGAIEFLISLGKAYEAKDMVDINFGFAYTAPDILHSSYKSLNFLSIEAFREQ